MDHTDDQLGDKRSRPATRTPGACIAGGLVLVLAAYLPGCPSSDAPWIAGDEFVFIVNNPEVTGAGLEDGGFAQRWADIFAWPPKEDLYQPIAILSYAIEWPLWNGEAVGIRRTDMLLHGLNAVLLWCVLAALLEPSAQPGSRAPLAMGWVLALLWSAHPALVSAYASDMGRTHLLSAAFALTSLLLHLRALATGRWVWFALAALVLVLAMLSKVIPGWVAVVFVLEWIRVGLWRALRAPRVYVVGAICVAAAVMTYVTSAASGLIEDASQGLFGDPIARSLLGVWIYARNLLAPFWLLAWYLPDPETHWLNWRVWAGLAIVAASAGHAVRATRKKSTQPATLGWVWFWALLLPVIGLVGAREAAAADRYLYQPTMGLALVVGTLLVRWLARRPEVAPQRTRAVVIAGAALGALLVLLDVPYATIARSPIRRAQRVVANHPGDPRALEMQAMAYNFSRNHPLPRIDRLEPPEDNVNPRLHQYQHFDALFRETLRAAAATPDLDYYFPRGSDRAPFHRRLAFRFLTAGQPEAALHQAELAAELEPDTYLTLRQLAFANRALQRYPQALHYYLRLEPLIPDEPIERATRLTELGDLLLRNFDQPREARPRLITALETGAAPIEAAIDLALCEIRGGEGAAGLAILRDLLAREPGNLDAALVLGEYHLRSHNWVEARGVYEHVLSIRPNWYDALRGYHEACAQMGDWPEAASMWEHVLRNTSEPRVPRSFFVWTLACAGDESAGPRAEALLRDDADNPMACYAQMLLALRQEQWEEALRWIERARAGVPIPEARAAERAAATIQLLVQAGELSEDAVLARAALLHEAGQTARAREELGARIVEMDGSASRGLAERLLRDLEAVPATP